MNRSHVSVLTVVALSLAIAAHEAQGGVISVTDGPALADALSNAKPGDVIDLAPGTYKGNFTSTVSGTDVAPITLQGPASAVLDGGDARNGVGLYLYGVQDWMVRGVTVRNVLDGVVLDRASRITLDGVTITETGGAGLQMRAGSSDNLIENMTVSYTGQVNPAAGAGVVIGSDSHDWHAFTQGQPDASNNNTIADNHFGPYVTAQSVIAMEGSQGGEIRGNYFDATGMTDGTGTWMEMRGNGYAVRANTGSNGILTNLMDGVQVRSMVPGWGQNNVFRENYFVVGAQGYGISVDAAAKGNRVYSTNTVLGASAGLSNVPVSR